MSEPRTQHRPKQTLAEREAAWEAGTVEITTDGLAYLLNAALAERHQERSHD